MKKSLNSIPMAKQYKPGQLITINHKVYRIHKHVVVLGSCGECAFRDTYSKDEPCFSLCFSNKRKLPYGYYLKLVKS